jgi:hypothetical protein
MVIGRPGSPEAHTVCRRCRKGSHGWGPDAAHEFYRSGLDEESQERKTFIGFP